MKSRGFVLTIDSMLALVIAASMIVVVLEMSAVDTPDSLDYLYSFHGDFLATMEKSGILGESAAGNNTRLQQHLFAQPTRLCLNLTVSNSSGHVLYHNITDCPASGYTVASKRSFVYEDGFYIAELGGWYI